MPLRAGTEMAALLSDSRTFSRQSGVPRPRPINPAPTARNNREGRPPVLATSGSAQALVSGGLPQRRQSMPCLQIIQAMISF